MTPDPFELGFATLFILAILGLWPRKRRIRTEVTDAYGDTCGWRGMNSEPIHAP